MPNSQKKTALQVDVDHFLFYLTSTYVSLPGNQKWFHHLQRTPCFQEQCCSTSQAESRQSAPPQGWEPPAGYQGLPLMSLWKEWVKRKSRDFACKTVCTAVHRAKGCSLTVHNSPASDVAHEAIRQRLIGGRKVSNLYIAVAIHRYSQSQDSNVISAKNKSVNHCN